MLLTVAMGSCLLLGYVVPPGEPCSHHSFDGRIWIRSRQFQQLRCRAARLGDHFHVSLRREFSVALLSRDRNWGNLKHHEETWAFAIILGAVSVALIIDRAWAGSFDGTAAMGALDTLFNAVSISTTSGYVIGDYDGWPVFAKGLLLFLMILGGCAGSTAGGLKVSRLLLWFKMVRMEIRRAYRPNEVVKLRLNGRVVPAGTRGQLSTIVTSAAAAIAIGSYLLVAFGPDKSIDGCVSAVISCLSNVGPAFNEFGPTHNFAEVSPPSMILLSLLMLIGRLKYIAVFVLFSKMLWQRY